MFTDEQIKYMRDRFLGWKLPENFNPDGGISFAKKPYNHVNEPYGTNVFDAQQAEQMIRYMIDGMPQAEPDYIDGRSYMQRVPAGEPVFILRAQDKLASHFVRQWAVVAKEKGLSDERYENAMKVADAMKAWPVKKLPD